MTIALELENYLERCRGLAKEAGVVLMDYWRRPSDLNPTKKSDGTPATVADLAAHEIINQGLMLIGGGKPVLSEEGTWPDFSERSNWGQYWLVDPLDGTQGFIAHLEQFSINIALIENNLPILGIIYAPATETCYFACQGFGAFKQIGSATPQRIQPRALKDNDPWRIVLGQYSRGKRIEQLIKNDFPYQLLHVNGSLKFGWLAEGQADLYPRFGPISEWDTAAGQCILSESGGIVVDLQGRTLQYNRKASLLNPDFIAVADSCWIEPWLEILNRRI